jgi:hypothetical protein
MSRPQGMSGIFFPTCIVDGHLHRMTHSRCCIDRIDSPDDEHEFARNIQRIEINIQKKRAVRQVGHLQELYWDVRSAEHKMAARSAEHKMAARSAEHKMAARSAEPKKFHIRQLPPILNFRHFVNSIMSYFRCLTRFKLDLRSSVILSNSSY